MVQAWSHVKPGSEVIVQQAQPFLSGEVCADLVICYAAPCKAGHHSNQPIRSASFLQETRPEPPSTVQYVCSRATPT